MRERFQQVGGGGARKASLALVSLDRMREEAGEQESDEGMDGGEARKPKTVIMNEVEPRVVKTVKRMRKVMKKRVKIVKKMVKKVKKKVVEEKEDAEDEEEAAPTSKSYKNKTKHPIPLRAKPKLNAKKTGKQVEAGEVVECELKVRLLYMTGLL